MTLGKFMLKVRGFFKENYGAPFVIGFQLLLLATAAFLAAGNSALANEVAVYAYCLLVIGVVLQLVSFVRVHGKESGPK